MSQDNPNYRQLFYYIINGYTSVTLSDFGLINIKHLTNLDISEIDFWNNFYLEEAKKNGIPTREEKIKYLINNNIWSKDKENKIKDYKSLLSNYEMNKSKEFLKSKRVMWEKEIEKLQKDIKYLEFEREHYIKETAEFIAARKSSAIHITKSFFRDLNFKEPIFSKEILDSLSDEKLKEIHNLFNKYLETFNSESLKKLSISPVFLSLFFLSPESIYEFYGKPVIQLTTYQIDLFSFGRYFKSLLSEYQDKLPKDILEDPDKMIEYVELNRNYKKAFPDDKEQDAGSLVGANKEDYKILGMQPSNKLSQELKKKGSLKMDDLLAIQSI